MSALLTPERFKQLFSLYAACTDLTCQIQQFADGHQHFSTPFSVTDDSEIVTQLKTIYRLCNQHIAEASPAALYTDGLTDKQYVICAADGERVYNSALAVSLFVFSHFADLCRDNDINAAAIEITRHREIACVNQSGESADEPTPDDENAAPAIDADNANCGSEDARAARYKFPIEPRDAVFASEHESDPAVLLKFRWFAVCVSRAVAEFIRRNPLIGSQPGQLSADLGMELSKMCRENASYVKNAPLLAETTPDESDQLLIKKLQDFGCTVKFTEKGKAIISKGLQLISITARQQRLLTECVVAEQDRRAVQFPGTAHGWEFEARRPVGQSDRKNMSDLRNLLHPLGLTLSVRDYRVIEAPE